MGDADETSVASNDGKPAQSATPSISGEDQNHETDKELAKKSQDHSSSSAYRGSSQTGPAKPEFEDDHRPPLPPRPSNLALLQENKPGTGNTLRLPKRTTRPQLQSTPTTAISRTDIHTQSYLDGSRETTASSAQTTPSSKPGFGFGSIRRFKGFGSSEGDSASIKSYAPTLSAGGDVESLLGEVLGPSQESPAWKRLGVHAETIDPFDAVSYEDNEATVEFYREFDEIPNVAEGNNEGTDVSLKSASCTKFTYRATFGSVEIEEKALSYSLIRWEANI